MRRGGGGYSVVGSPKTGLIDHGSIDDGLQRHVVVAGEGGGGGVVAVDEGHEDNCRCIVLCMESSNGNIER
jgi:hypothetical protein